MKRTSFVMMVALLFTFVTSVSISAEQIVLQHLGYVWHGDPWHQYMEKRIEEFEALYPNVKIERTLAGQGNRIEDRYIAMVAGGITPDVVEMTLSQGGGMAPQGAFLDLRPFFERDPDINLEDFAPTAIQALTWSDGTIWGLPMDVYPVASYYNIDLFSQAGLATPGEIAPEEWNWNYAMDAARRMTIDTDGDGQPDQWGIDNAWSLVSYGIPMKQAGGGLYDQYVDPQESRLLDERTMAGFEWIAQFYHQGFNAPDYDVAIEHGRTGFNLTTGPTWIQRLQQGDVFFQWDVGPALTGPDNNGTYIAVNSIQISAHTTQAEMAWEWAKFLAANPPNMEDFVQRTTRIPSLLSVLPRYPTLIGDAPAGVNHFVDTVLNPYSFHPPVGPTTTPMGELIFSTFMNRIATGEASVRTAFEEIMPQINALLNQGSGR